MQVMTEEQKEIASKAINSLIEDLKKEGVFSDFEQIRQYVKKQFKEQTAIAKTYIKAAMQYN